LSTCHMENVLSELKHMRVEVAKLQQSFDSLKAEVGIGFSAIMELLRVKSNEGPSTCSKEQPEPYQSPNISLDLDSFLVGTDYSMANINEMKSKLEHELGIIKEPTDILHNTPTQQTNISQSTPQQETNITQITPQQQTNITQSTPQQRTNITQSTPQQQTNITQSTPQQQTYITQSTPQQQTAITQSTPQQKSNVTHMPKQQPQQQAFSTVNTEAFSQLTSPSLPTSQQTSIPVDVNPYDAKWQYLKELSHSREHFTWIVAQEIYPSNELVGHRVKGTEDHPCLCKIKLLQVKNIVLMFFPMKAHENPIKAWRLCEKNLDTNLRRKPKEKKN